MPGAHHPGLGQQLAEEHSVNECTTTAWERQSLLSQNASVMGLVPEHNDQPWISGAVFNSMKELNAKHTKT